MEIGARTPRKDEFDLLRKECRRLRGYNIAPFIWTKNGETAKEKESSTVSKAFRDLLEEVNRLQREKEKNKMETSLARKDVGKDETSDKYSELHRVLMMAYDQAANGKGKERHANDERFEDQPIMTIAKGHGMGYQTGQAAKKLQEAHKLLVLKGKDAAIREILGAINYSAAAILLLEQMEEGEIK